MYRRPTWLAWLQRTTLVALLGLSPFLAVEAQRATAGRVPPEAAYLGQTPPGETPVLFAPGILAANAFLGPLAFSPDGAECFFTVDGELFWVSTGAIERRATQQSAP